MVTMKRVSASVTLLAGLAAQPVAAEQIRISCDWGSVTATLADNAAAAALSRMLPLTVAMNDLFRQEKTGELPAPLPTAQRQTPFTAGTLGLWSSGDFVIYYRNGHVPQPGITVLGQVIGDVSMLDRPGSITVRIERAD